MRHLLLIMLAACAANHRDPQSVVWRAPVDIASGGGTRGPWQQNDSHYDYVDDPSVALAPDGAAAIVWVDHRDKDVHFQIYEPDGRPRFAAPVNVSRSPEIFSWLPRVAISPRDPSHVYIVWQEIVFSGGPHGGDIYFARSRDGGRTFEPPVDLSHSIEGDGKGRINAERWRNGSFDLAIGADGTLAVAWTAYEGPLWFRTSRDGGATFEDVIVVDAARVAPARSPALAFGNGVIALAWSTGEDPQADIHVAMSRDGRSFGRPAIVARSPSFSDAPALAFDASGTLHLAYADSAGGPFARPDTRYTRSRDGATFEPPRTIARGAGSPSLAVAGDRVYVAWDRYPEGSEQAHGIGLSYSRDGGATFSQSSLVPGTDDAGANGSREGRLVRTLAVRDDTIVIVNSALEPGKRSRVWFVRGQIAAGAR